MVTRYDMTVESMPVTRGDWVMYDDYEDLEKEKQTLEMEVAALESKVAEYEDQIEELKSEVVQLRSRLRGNA